MATTERGRRARRESLEMIHVIGDPLDCSDSAIGIAESLFEAACEADLLLGRSKHTIAAACLYHAARTLGETRTPTEIAETHDAVDRKRLTSAIRYLSRELSLRTPPPRPEHHLGDFADRLDLDIAVRDEARRLIEAGGQEGVTNGQAPTAIAAAALYAASCRTGKSMTQKEISHTCDVSDVSIRTHYRDLIDALEGGTS